MERHYILDQNPWWCEDGNTPPCELQTQHNSCQNPSCLSAVTDKVILKFTWRFKVLIHATTWMNLENMLSGKKPVTKISYYRTPFIWSVQNRQIYKDRKYISIYQGPRWGNEEWQLMDRRFLSGIMKMYWNYIMMMTPQFGKYTKNH